MAVSSCRLEDILPHRAPMILIDEIIDFDASAKAVTAAVIIKPEWSDNHVAIEFMAQTAAALVGLSDRAEFPGRPPRPGFLLGTRKLELSIDRFTVGERYLVTAAHEFSDSGAASFHCRITHDGNTVASALINAYRPDDIGDFMASR